MRYEMAKALSEVADGLERGRLWPVGGSKFLQQLRDCHTGQVGDVLWHVCQRVPGPSGEFPFWFELGKANDAGDWRKVVSLLRKGSRQ